jgi:hypothetical protein
VFNLAQATGYKNGAKSSTEWIKFW